MLIVYCLTQVTEGTDRESMEGVSEPGGSVDAGDPELDPGASPRLSEHGEEDNFVAEKEMESKDIEHKETESAVAPSPVSVSALNPSPSQSSLITEETVGTVLAQGGEPGSTSESEKEATGVKTEEDFELSEENVAVKDNNIEKGPAGPDVSEDTNMDKTTDEKMEPDIDTEQEKESVGCKLSVDDLDEMMDIGTVDQVEQEAQMKEEEQNSLDMDGSRSPAVSNTGKMKQKFYFFIKGFVLMMQKNS